MIDPGLRGRSVLVTGTNNRFGIGAAIALAFARLGATLFLHYHRTPLDDSSDADVYRAQQASSSDSILQSIAEIGGRAAAYETDFSDPAAIAPMFDAAERFCGSIDVLINNAATWSADTFLPSRESRRNRFIELWTDSGPALSSESATRHMVVNAVVPSLLMTEFARRHVARRATSGRIVNISTAGSECFPSEASYGASKYALESYTRTAAQELGRIGTPDDVADVVVFLTSEQARWVTGQKIFVDGGHHA